jgi:hypothetical protein
MPRFFSLSVLLALVCTLPLSAATNRVWTGGGGDGLFTNTANWTGGTVPANNDYGDTAVFGSPATAGTVTLSASRSIHSVSFTSAGWTLTGSNFSNFTALSSAGIGTNIFDVSFELQYNNANWNVSLGNTLLMTKAFYQRDRSFNVAGGGTLAIGTAITGFGGTVGAWGMKITDATTVRFDTATPYSTSSAGAVFLNDAGARVQILTSVSAAELLIGNRIRDGVGSGLLVTDIGGGYVEITSLAAVPEPATLGLLAGLAFLGFAAGRRRRGLLR